MGENEGNTEKQQFPSSEGGDGDGEAEGVAGVMWVDPAIEEDHGVSAGRGVSDIFENRGKYAYVSSTAATAVAVKTVPGVSIYRNASLPNPGDMFPLSPIYQLLIFSIRKVLVRSFFLFFKLSCP